MKIKFKIISCLLVLCAVLSVATISASALSWDGSSTGGTGGGSPAGPNGYAIRTTGDNCLGYRFSVVDKNGNNKVSKVIDVFRNTSYGNLAYGSAYKFNSKYNKKQLINNQNASFSTGSSTSNCYKEANMGFAATLPTPNGMGTWQNNKYNINPILVTLGISGGMDSLKNGDKVLVEPLFDVRLQSVYHSVTVTEIAIYGKYILGSNSNGGSSSTSSSWGFIAQYTNKIYPNALYTPDGQGLWSGADGLSKQATFYNIINQGYGVGIAYTETKPDFTPNLNVNCCEAWPGAKSSRNNHFGISYGSSFSNYVYGNGYPTTGNTVWYAVNFPAESENCYVRQSVWVDGGGSTSRNVYSNSNTWYDVALSPTQVDSGRSSYIVKARVDWIDGNGTVLKYGAEKTFYIPIKPVINRYQVTMYSVTGATAAYNGSGGSSGVVYAGQRVRAQYTYTSGNSWTSYNHVRGSAYGWKNGAWNTIKSGNPDVYVDGVGINSSSPYNRNSDLGLFTVPDNSANTNGVNRIPFKLWTHWSSDTARTQQETWIDIPIVKADAELYDIRLVDENGYYLNPTNLEAGQKVTVQYGYKNNTSCTIYVNGYNDNRSQISGIYSIASGKTIWVSGYSFEVPNKRDFNIWGGVYLDGAGLYNTGYESNGNNNTMILNCKVNLPLRLTPITPNATYREATSVITSYWITNNYRDNYIQADSITVRFRVYKGDGITLITTETKTQVVVPGNDKNLVYFKWNVPTGLSGGNVTIKADIQQYGIYYNLVSKAYSTTPYYYYETPDTKFENSAPSGFSAPSTPMKKTGYATWWEYSYEHGAYNKNNYGIGIYADGTNSIIPATGSTAVQNGSEWTMKSGYGFTLQSYNALVSVSGFSLPSYNSYTGSQYGYATFPEYGYSFGSRMCRTLDRISSYYVFPNNGDYGKIHFTPLWYPNGNYTVRVVKSDCWTPMGMVISESITNTIKIKDSVYDDWFVGQK